MNHAGQYRIELKKDPTLGDLDYAYDDNFYFSGIVSANLFFDFSYEIITL